MWCTDRARWSAPGTASSPMTRAATASRTRRRTAARTSTPIWSRDLEAVLDERELERVVLVGASMGAATTLAYALEHPERVAALVQITPAHLGLPQTDPAELARWDALADGLERDGVDGFMRAYGDPPVEPRFRGLIVEAIRQRLSRHLHPEAVAAALRVVPRSTAFDGVVALEQLALPTLIVASHDDLDPEHPYEVAQIYVERIEGAELVSEEPGPRPWPGAGHSSRGRSRLPGAQRRW